MGMFADASGEKKMRIGKGAKASEKPADAVAATPATGTTKAADTTKPAAGTTTKPAAGTKTRMLQDAKTTTAGKATTTTTTPAAPKVDWKTLKSEDDFMRVVVNKKMFEKGGPLFGVKKPIIMFNKHSPDYVAEFPRGKRGTYDPTTGKRANATALAAVAAAKNASEATAEDDDWQLNDTVAQQVMELEFVNGDDMSEIAVKGLKKGMLQVCMMMKNEKQRIFYHNEENDEMQDDGIAEASRKQQSTRDDENEQERKGWEMCVDLTHATTFATIDDSANSNLFSYSMMVLMALLAVLFFKQE